jgi:hypothetical protein
MTRDMAHAQIAKGAIAAQAGEALRGVVEGDGVEKARDFAVRGGRELYEQRDLCDGRRREQRDGHIPLRVGHHPGNVAASVRNNPAARPIMPAVKRLEAIFFHPPVKRSARQAQRLGRAADIALMPVQRMRNRICVPPHRD